MARYSPRTNRKSIVGMNQKVSIISDAVFPETNKVSPDNNDIITIEDINGDRFYVTVAQLSAAAAGITVLDSYTSDALPSASPAGQVIYISDEGVMAYCNGTNWIS